MILKCVTLVTSGKNTKLNFPYLKIIVYSLLESAKLKPALSMVFGFGNVKRSIFFEDVTGYLPSRESRHLYNFILSSFLVCVYFKFRYIDFMFYIGTATVAFMIQFCT